MKLRKKIITSAQEIFTTMIMTEIEASDEDACGLKTYRDSISGIIGITGRRKGTLAIHLPTEVAIGITANFLGLEDSEVEDDVEDAIGELANMLGGSLKAMLANGEGGIELSLPSTISGSKYDIQMSKGASCVHIPFSSKVGTFSIELQLEK